jgi:quinolinate synthase
MDDQQHHLPSRTDRSDEELIEAIRTIKAKQGERLTILGHHYQPEAITGLSDFLGDSFKLCRSAAEATAEIIVFCGVRFMAESARVLARPTQIVQHPNEDAGCPMADMADIVQVERAWDVLTRLQAGKRIIPVTYMNSDVEIKAFCGRHGGLVCTSSNAPKAFAWAYERGDTILFFPDEHLGRNTADLMGMDPENVLMWDPDKADEIANDARFAETPLVVWKGHCHVHTHFTVEQVHAARREYPGAHVVVHPECPRDVVAEADSAGSTELMVGKVAEAAPGETIVIGTELNLVTRLAHENPQLTVVPLSRSACPNMARINLANLLRTLEGLGEIGKVELDEEVSAQAKMALDRMLELA